MRAITIPSPDVKEINGFMLRNAFDETYLTTEYMNIISNNLRYISGGGSLRYSYEIIRTDLNQITATVDTLSLPVYSEMAAHFYELGFEKNLIERLERIELNQFSPDMPPTPENLRKPLKSWDSKWITAYIWTLLGCEHVDGFDFLDDSVTKDALFETLIETLNESLGCEDCEGCDCEDCEDCN